MKSRNRLTCLFLVLSLAGTVSACRFWEDPEKVHESAASQIAEMNGERSRIRKEFLASESCRSAEAYLKDAIRKQAPDAEAEISIEPGAYYHESLAPLSESVQTPEQARAFFAKAQLSFSVTIPGDSPSLETLAEALAGQGISGQLTAEGPSRAYYDLSAEKGTAALVQVPEV